MINADDRFESNMFEDLHDVIRYVRRYLGLLHTYMRCAVQHLRQNDVCWHLVVCKMYINYSASI